MKKLKLDIWPPENKFSQFFNYSSLREVFDLKEIKNLRGKRIFDKLNMNFSSINSLYMEFQRRKDVPLLLMTHINPVKLKPPYMVFFHDIIPWKKDLIYGDHTRTFDYEGIINMTLSAEKILAPSRYSKKKILELFEKLGVEEHTLESKIEVVFPFVDQNIFKPKAEKSRKPEGQNHRIITVGSDHFRKNQINAIISVYIANKYYGIITDLTIVTQKRTRFNEIKTLASLYNEKLGRKFIEIRTYVAVDELVKLYQESDLMLFVSFEEGFGIPPVEAQSCGLPVIASNVSCIPEVLSDGAYYVDPYDPKEISEAIFRVLTDDSLKISLIKKGVMNAKRYSAEFFARKIHELVSGIYKEGKNSK